MASPFRRQKVKELGGDGKELCDVLAVCGDHIVVFSDKEVAFQANCDLKLAWSRWYRRAVEASVKQLRGAGRWLMKEQDKLYADRACTIPLPFELPLPERAKMHFVAVASGAADACRGWLGGDGSLMINIGADSDHPFDVPNVFDGIFVHVFDEITLPHVLRQLDTVTDLVGYLSAKERLIPAGKTLVAPSEAEILAYYYLNRESNQKNPLLPPKGADRIYLDQGFAQDFYQRPEVQYTAKLNQISRLWDSVIEEFTTHLQGGSLIPMYGPTVPEKVEVALRQMALEPRHSRRVLSEHLWDKATGVAKGAWSARVAQSLSRPRDMYAFVVMDPIFPNGMFPEAADYRELRRKYLEGYVFAVAASFDNLDQVIGIATECGSVNPGRSHDIIQFRVADLDEEDINYGEAFKKATGVLARTTRFQTRTSFEFEKPEGATVAVKGRRTERRSTSRKKKRNRKDRRR